MYCSKDLHSLNMRCKKSFFYMIFFFLLCSQLITLDVSSLLHWKGCWIINSFLPLPSLIYQTFIKSSFSCLFSSRTSPCLLSQSKNSIQYSFSSLLPFFEPFCRGGWELRCVDLFRSINVPYLFCLLSLRTLRMLFSFFNLSELWKVS